MFVGRGWGWVAQRDDRYERVKVVIQLSLCTETDLTQNCALPLNLTLDKKPQRNSTWRSKQNARMHNKTKYKPFYYLNKAIQYLTQVEVIAFRLKNVIILTL